MCHTIKEIHWVEMKGTEWEGGDQEVLWGAEQKC